MKKHDIVYILKNGIDSDEIRYSLRSVEMNFPHRRVWFYGGKPKGITPDEYVKVIQEGDSRYSKVTNTIKQVCRNNEITDSFWLFNDDFFVMQPITEEFAPLISGTIEERVQYIINRHGSKSKYARNLERTGEVLRAKGYGDLCYAIHAPILINRRTALAAMAAFPGESMFRCIYGNYAGGQAQKICDVKVFGNEEPLTDTAFLSTDDAAFASTAGRYIRDRYPGASRWEAADA